jgi:hypothetical protein
MVVFKIISFYYSKPMPMSINLAPPPPGGSRTFSITTWNIRCARGAGLVAAAKGLHQMGVGCCVVSEMKITGNCYPKFISGYRVIALKAMTSWQGGIALLWEEDHQGFKVEAVRILSPNLLTFQLVTRGA